MSRACRNLIEDKIRMIYLPGIVSTHALISRMTPFGDCSLVVLMIVISIRDTRLSEGIWAESTVAGFLVSSFGLDEDSIGLSLILFPSGE